MSSSTDEASQEEETQDDWISRVDALLGNDDEGEEDFQQLSIAAVLAQTGDEADADLPSAVVTDEVADMLDMADSLIAHETPAPAVAPEPIDIPIPEPIVLPVETHEMPLDELSEPSEGDQEEDDAVSEETTEVPEAEEEEQPEEPEQIPIIPPKKKKKLGRVL